MTNKFLYAGIAAILLAVLFPIYWGSMLGMALDDLEAVFRKDLSGVNWSDLFMLVIGILEVYVYWNLKEALKNNFNSVGCQVLLLIMVFSVVLFHLTLLIDLSMLFSSVATLDSNLYDFAILYSFAAIIIYVLAGLALSIMLIINGRELSRTLLVFAIVFLVSNLLQLFGFYFVASLVLFPMSVVVLAIYFIKEPDRLEVV